MTNGGRRRSPRVTDIRLGLTNGSHRPHRLGLGGARAGDLPAGTGPAQNGRMAVTGNDLELERTGAVAPRVRIFMVTPAITPLAR